MQHIHYANKGLGLTDFSLFEYVALLHIVPKWHYGTEMPSSSNNILR
jgi:hypothetical protein